MRNVRVRASESNVVGAKEIEFGNSVYKIRFLGNKSCTFPYFCVSPNEPFGVKYNFNLEDAIEDCPEYIVPLITLQQLLLKHGVLLERRQSFHEFAIDALHNEEFQQLMHRMKVFGTDGVCDEQQWEAIGLYQILVFRKLTLDELKQRNLVEQATLFKQPDNNFKQEIFKPKTIDQSDIIALS